MPTNIPIVIPSQTVSTVIPSQTVVIQIPDTPTPTPDSTRPVVTLTSPAANAVVSGSNVILNAAATDNVGIAGVQFKIDNVAVGPELTVSPYSLAWDSKGAVNGAHVITAFARDTAGNTRTSASRTITVANIVVTPPPDIVPPVIAMTAPFANSVVAGTVQVAAAASDNVGVLGVSFQVNGQAVSTEDPTAPYSILWDTTTVANGQHSIMAIARDAAGNMAAASPISVVVNNPIIVDPPPPTGNQKFVAPNGSDSADGGVNTPWRTIGKALMASGPGDTVNLRTGTYSEAIEMRGDPGNRFGKVMGGSPAGWWTLQSYPGEVAALNKSFDAYSIQYCRFKDFSFTTGGKLVVMTADWITPMPPRSHHIETVDIRYAGTQPRYGVLEVMFDDSKVEGSNIAITTGGDTTDHGIYLHNGKNNSVLGNVIRGMSGYGIHAYDERKGNSDPQTFFDNVRIAGNTCYGSRQRAGIIASQGGDTQIRSIVIENNVCYENATGDIELTNYGNLPMLGIKTRNNTCTASIYWENPKITAEIVRNIAMGGIQSGGGTIIETGNFVTGDPMWVDPAAHDYHLKAGSPAAGCGAFPVPV